MLASVLLLDKNWVALRALRALRALLLEDEERIWALTSQDGWRSYRIRDGKASYMCGRSLSANRASLAACLV